MSYTKHNIYSGRNYLLCDNGVYEMIVNGHVGDHEERGPDTVGEPPRVMDCHPYLASSSSVQPGKTR